MAIIASMKRRFQTKVECEAFPPAVAGPVAG